MAAQATAEETKVSASEDQSASLKDVVQLFQSARLFQSSLPGSEDTRSKFLYLEAGKVTSQELDAVQFVSSLVDGSGNPFGSRKR